MNGAENAGACWRRTYSSETMNREAESRLIDFCVEQYGRFNPAAWENFTAVTSLELAAVARFLAGVEWFGHQTELREVADRVTSARFAELARDTRFSPSRFAGLLMAHLGRRTVTST